MLNCNEVTHLASDHLDKNLNWKESFSLRMHIAMCKHCRRFIHHLRITKQCVHGMKENVASPDDVKHVLDNLPDTKKPQS